MIRAVAGQNGRCPPIFLSPQSRTPGRMNTHRVRHGCSQTRHIHPPDWCVGPQVHSSRSSPAMTRVHDALLEVGKFSKACPPAQHPQDHPRWCRHPAQESTWIVPCACASDSNCSTPLWAATRAQATWSQKPALALRSPATPLPVLPEPHQSPICFT